jgi:hypothetical protein
MFSCDSKFNKYIQLSIDAKCNESVKWNGENCLNIYATQKAMVINTGIY